MEEEKNEKRTINFDLLSTSADFTDEYSFYSGFIEACEMFATWNNGTRYIGSGQWTIQDIKDQIESCTQYRIERKKK